MINNHIRLFLKDKLLYERQISELRINGTPIVASYCRK